MSFSVDSKEHRAGVFLVTPVGRIDSETAKQFEKKMDYLLVSDPKEIAIDMVSVDYLSSAGVRVFFKSQKTLLASGGSLSMLRVQPKIQKVFETINALPNERIFSSVEELDAYLDKVQKGEV